MLDFFDEDFPLTKKQEEIKKAMEAAEKSALSDAPKPAENDSTSVNTPPVADEPVAVEQTAETVIQAVPEAVAEVTVEPAVESLPKTVAETVPEPVAEATPIVAAETVTETAQKIAAEPITEAVSETVAETTSEVAAEPVVETTSEVAAEPVVETASEVVAETIADSFPEATAETAAESAAIAEPVEEVAEPVFETESAAQVLPEAARDTAPSAAAEQTVEAATEYVSEPVYETISEPVQEEVSPTISEPEAVPSDKDDEDAAIKRIFQPIHEENVLPESDNQAFSYEYDGRYFAEEETPAYRYGASASPRRRTRPARSLEAKDGSITVSTKTLLKVGAVVAATAAAVKLLSKKD